MVGRGEAFELVLELDVLGQQGSIECSKKSAAVLTGHQHLHRLSITRVHRQAGKEERLKWTIKLILLLLDIPPLS